MSAARLLRKRESPMRPREARRTRPAAAPTAQVSGNSNYGESISGESSSAQSLSSSQNVPAVDAEKVGIAGERPPLRLGMVKKFREKHATKFSGLAVIRPRVVYNLSRGTGANDDH